MVLYLLRACRYDRERVWCICFFFFFSSRRRHTRFDCDWSSDVCSSDLYEIQVEYEAPGTDDKYHGMGSIYGFLAPSVELPGKPGEWESYDATLVGRYEIGRASCRERV